MPPSPKSRSSKKKLATPGPASINAIRVCGARTHNLRNIDVEIPIGRLTTVTGVSGSGKSSLAFDTIYAEGLHRYLATVSPQTRELMRQLDRPDVDLIDGLPPTLGLQQRSRGPRRRTTLATITEIYDYVRLLYARLGHLHCPTCHRPVTSQTREMIVEQVLQLDDRRKALILAPLIRNKAGSHSDVLTQVGKDGFVRARVDGELVDAASPPQLSPAKPHTIEVVIDRLVIKEGIRNRVEESIDLALQVGQGQCILSHEMDGTWYDRLYSSHLACLECQASYPAIEPGDFSFNSPRGACPTCQGLGTIAVDGETVSRKDLQSQQSMVCPDCKGARLATLPLAVLFNGVSIGQLVTMSASDSFDQVTRWAMEFSGEGRDEMTIRVARHLLPEITSRLKVLNELGLNYLHLNRAGDSLSAGEYQRARLTSCLGSQLTGVCYVIDEPTAGLHAVDTARLLQTLFHLRDQGNTLIVVEHDLDLVRQSDHTVEIGPGAGTEGGCLVASSSPRELLTNDASVTGRELRRRSESLPTGMEFEPKRCLTLRGATLHNLRDMSVTVPLNGLVCITGVSGSGKTSLLMHTLVPAVLRALGQGTRVPGPFRELEGVENISRLVVVDQRALGRSARSTPATYSGVWDEVRRVFAKTKESRIRGYSSRRFSLQHTEGRCATCAGRGTIEIDRKQLLDWSIRCPDCAGRRFNSQTLAVRYRNQSVADVLEMTIHEAAEFFVNLPRLARPLRLFCELGLGYLKLGQPSTTLSGGEAQRVKLATSLWKTEAGVPTLFVLDEPTSGLHAADIQQLIRALRGLVQAGNSVVLIEHHLDLIASADWVIDVGPGAGSEGGQIVVEGRPATVANHAESLTGRALRESFGV